MGWIIRRLDVRPQTTVGRIGEAKRGVCWALAGWLAGEVTPTTSFAHEDPQSTRAAQTLGSAKPTGTPTHYQPSRFPGRAAAYYRVVWGVDSLSVKAVESDQLIRFAWRVLDADKAKTLNNRSTEPLLIDPQRGVQLVVPSIGSVGPLRQPGASLLFHEIVIGWFTSTVVR